MKLYCKEGFGHDTVVEELSGKKWMEYDNNIYVYHDKNGEELFATINMIKSTCLYLAIFDALSLLHSTDKIFNHEILELPEDFSLKILGTINNKDI